MSEKTISSRLSHKRRLKSGMVESFSISSMIADIIIYVILFGLMLICIIPLLHVLMASFSDGKQLLANEGVLWRPAGKKFNFDGYRLLFKDAGILKGYANTLFYVAGGTVFGMFINITGGYALSRKTKLKPFLILMVMFTMLFNGGLIPLYMVIKNLGWVGTRWSLLIPGCTNAFFLVMMMAAFNDVPEAIVESARIDGAGHMRVMFHIMLPQSTSMMAIIILNSVIGQWNSWFPASIYVTGQRDMWPLQLWIKQIIADNSGILQSAQPDYNRLLVQYAVIIIATFPILIAFPFFQKTFEKGMLIGGVKG